LTKGGKAVCEREEKAARWWGEFLIERLTASLGAVRPDHGIDPRFIDVFMIRKQA
jgi:hypothetical protein